MPKRIIRREPIDFNKALKGSQEITVIGVANTELRQEAIKKAIALSQKDPEWKGMDGGDGKRYFGVKVYAGYPETLEERTDYFPVKFGSIVFKIVWEKDVTDAGVYYLELFIHNQETDIGAYFRKYLGLHESLAEINGSIKSIEYEREYFRTSKKISDVKNEIKQIENEIDDNKKYTELDDVKLRIDKLEHEKDYWK